MMSLVRTAPLTLLVASLLALALVGGVLAFLVWPAHAQSNDPPDEPTGLAASVVSGVGVNLTWNDPADATITGYEILRRDRAVDRQGVFHTIESDTGSADTAYTDATVVAGGEYVYRVKAINGHGRSVWSSYARADVPDNYEPPAPEHSPADLAPTNLSAALVDGGGVSLTWDPPAEDVDSITGYAILRAVGEAELSVLAADTDSTATAYTDATATDKGSTYAYQVKALRDGEESQASNRAGVQVPHDPADLAPSGLTAQLIDGGKVSLTWDPPAEDVNSVTQYKVLRTGQAPTRSVRTASTATDYTDSATDSGERYTYVVFALRDGELSQGSNEVEVQVPHDPADLAPTGLTAQLADDGISLNWEPPTEEAASVTGYAILRAVGDGALTTLVADTSGTATSYTDTTSTEAGTTYAYQVKAWRGEEQSEASNRAAMQIPHDPADLAPTSLTAALIDGSGVSLDWDAPAEEADAVTGYRILRSAGGGELGVLVENTASKTTAYTDATATAAGTTYGYQVKALRDEELSQGSNTASVDVPDAAEPSESQNSGDGVLLWSATLTVGDKDGVLGYSSLHDIGELSPATFSLDDTEYAVRGVAHNADKLTLGLDQALPAGFALQAGGSEFASSDASTTEGGYAYQYQWPKGALSWSQGDEVAVSLTATEEPEPTDRPHGLTATVSGKTVVLAWQGAVDGPTRDYHQVLRHRPELDEGEPQPYMNNVYSRDATFTDYDVEPGVLYAYQVRAMVDYFGNLGEASRPAEVRTPEDTGSAKSPPPVITGTAQEGQTLTADTSPITDDDGMTQAAFSYQWVSHDGTAGYRIPGATAASYTPASWYVGKTLRVRVSFTDDGGNDETLFSAPTAPVAAKVNHPASGKVLILGTPRVGETLQADTSRIEDDDGFSRARLRYRWLSHDGGRPIEGATAAAYTPAAEYEGATVSLRVSFTDNAGNHESLRSAPVHISGPNHDPTGLTAGLVDGGVSLSWSPPVKDAGSVTGYEILRAVGDGEETALVADTGNAETAYTDATATEKGTTYSYRVRALRGEERSEATNRARARVPHDPADLAPSGLVARVWWEDADTPLTVRLVWDAPAADAGAVTGYRILRGAAAGNLSVLAADTGNAETSYTDASAESGVFYRYAVAALRGAEQSQTSDTTGAYIPSGVLVSAPDDDHIAMPGTGTLPRGEDITTTPGMQVRDLTADSVLIIVDPSQIPPGFHGSRHVRFTGPGVAASLSGSGTWYRWRRLQADSKYTASVWRYRTGYQDTQPTGLEATFRTTYVKLGEIEIGKLTPTTAEVTVHRADVGGYRDYVVYLRYRPDGGSWSDPISVGGTTGTGPITDFSTRYHKARFTLTGLEQETEYDVQAYLDPDYPDNPSGIRQGRWQTLHNAFTTPPPPTPPTPVYEGTMVTGTTSQGDSGFETSTGTGSLTPSGFSLKESQYTFETILVDAAILTLTVTPFLPPDLHVLLHLGGFEYSSVGLHRTDAGHVTGYQWETPFAPIIPDWSDGETVQVALTPIVNICGRSPLARRVILAATPADDTCEAVSTVEFEDITSLDFPEQSQLTSILAGDFEGLTNLTHLDLSNAGIYHNFNHASPVLTGLLDPLVNLVELDLSGNDFSWAIEPEFFDELTNLEVLRLGDLELQPVLHPDTFSGLANLRKLDMRGYAEDDSIDALSTSPEAFLPLTSLQTYNGAAFTRREPPQNLDAYVLPIPVPSKFTNWKHQHTITLQWDPPVDDANLTGYRIRRAFDVSNPGHTPQDVTRTTPGVTHHTDGRDRSIRLGARGNARLFHPYAGRQSVKYLVSARYGDGTESLPAHITVTEKTDPPEATNTPTEVIEPRVSTYDLGPRRQFYRLTWDAAEDPTVTGYEIQNRNTPSDQWTTVVADTGNVILYDYHVLWDISVLTGIGERTGNAAFERNWPYQDEFRIRPLNAAGAGCWSGEVCPVGQEDFNTLLAAGNTGPRGIHSRDGIMYVLDVSHRKVHAYDLSTKARDTTKEFDLRTGSAPSGGIWTDGTTMWVAEFNDEADPTIWHAYAYKLTPGADYGARDADKDISLQGADAEALWSDGTTLWILQQGPDGAYAYDLTSGDRVPGKNITMASDNGLPSGMWSDGVTMWVSDWSDNKAYAYNLSTRARDTSKEFDLVSDNANPYGITSDGRIMWVADNGDDKLYAYHLPEGFVSQRPTPYDFNTLVGATNERPRDIHSHGGTMFVTDSDDDKIYAYSMSTGAQDTTKEFTLHMDNNGPTGVWSNADTMWVADFGEDKLFAYHLTDGAEHDYGDRDTSKEFDLEGVNSHPYAIWSDGETMWVSDTNDGATYAYKMTPGADFGDRDRGRDIGTAGDDSRGVWSDGDTMWLANPIHDKFYAYNLTTGARVPGKDFDTVSDNSYVTGIWSNGVIMWALDDIDDKIYAYWLPGVLD